MVKTYVGIDPGKNGAMASLLSNGPHQKPSVVVMDWCGIFNMYETLLLWKTFYNIQAVAIEKQHAMPKDSKQSATTFMQHTGEWKAAVKIAGLPLLEPRPQDWMYRRVKAKTGPKDKPSVEYVRARYPYVELSGPRGGVKDGRSDAICIAEWCKDQFNKGE